MLGYMSYFRRKKTNENLSHMLQNPETPIELILDEDELTQDLVLESVESLSYFTKEKVSKLIDYIIKIPKENETRIIGENNISFEQIAYKYPFNSCEILTTNLNVINGYLSLSEEDIRKSCQVGTYNGTNSNNKEEVKKQTNEDNIIKVNKEENKDENSIELLDKLLSFVETKEILNDVLSGYFSKILLNLIDKYPFKIIIYLYQYKYSTLESIIFHSYQNGISDIALKLLELEKYMINDNTRDTNGINQILQRAYESASIKRNKLLSYLIDLIDIKDEDITYKVNLVQNLIETDKIIEILMSNEEIVNKLFKKISIKINETFSDQIKTNYSRIIKLFTSIISNLNTNNINIPICEQTQNNQNENINNININDIKIIHTYFSKKLVSNLDMILSNFKEDAKTKSFYTSYNINKMQKSLGIINITIIELVSQLFTYFKNIPIILDTYLIKTNFIKTSIDFLFKYQWNNIYQQNFITMFKIFINDETIHKVLSHYIFTEMNLINKLINHISNDYYKFEKTNNEIRNGYFSSLIYLCYKINTFGGGKAVNIRSREGSFYFNTNPPNSNYYDYNPNNNNNTINKINVSWEIKSCLNEDWDYFFKQQIFSCVRLYETKLCDEDSYEDDIIDNESPISSSGTVYKFWKSEEKTAEDKGDKEKNFFKEVEDNMEKKENKVINIEIEELNVKVDEIDLNNYNDLSYWNKNGTCSKSKEYENEILKELEN